MSLAQRQGLIQGFVSGLNSSLQAIAKKEDDKFKKDLAKEAFQFQKDQAAENNQLKREQIEVGRESNRLGNLGRAEARSATHKAGLNTAQQNVKTIEDKLAGLDPEAFRDSASFNLQKKQLESELQKAKTEVVSAQGLFDTSQADVKRFSQTVSPPPVKGVSGKVAPPGTTGAVAAAGIPETKEEAEVASQVDTIQEPAEVAQEPAGVMDLSDIARGGQSIQDQIKAAQNQLQDEFHKTLSSDEKPIPEEEIVALEDKGKPEGLKSSDVKAAASIGIAPKENLKFRVAETDTRLQSSGEIKDISQFSDVDEITQNQLAKEYVNTLNLKTFDEEGHLEQMVGDVPIDNDLSDEIFSQRNIEKFEDGTNKLLESPKMQGILKDGTGRGNFIFFIHKRASKLASRVNKAKGGAPDPNPNDRIALRNAGRMADALFDLRDRLMSMNVDINESVSKAGSVPIDAEIIVPKLKVLNLEKQFFGKKPRAPKKVKPPKKNK
jgi:hypothetical protein